MATHTLILVCLISWNVVISDSFIIGIVANVVININRLLNVSSIESICLFHLPPIHIGMQIHAWCAVLWCMCAMLISIPFPFWLVCPSLIINMDFVFLSFYVYFYVQHLWVYESLSLCICVRFYHKAWIRSSVVAKPIVRLCNSVHEIVHMLSKFTYFNRCMHIVSNFACKNMEFFFCFLKWGKKKCVEKASF